MPTDGPKVVAFGGGHGLSASLHALRQVTPHLTAVVTVADDGGSSGVLREELKLLPPGDLRMALAALAGDDPRERMWARTLQHRFAGGGSLHGHPVGNLVLAGLLEVLDDPVAALDALGELVGARGRVLPLSSVPLEIVAEVSGLPPLGVAAELRGQVAVATTKADVLTVRVEPAEAPACDAAVRAVADADWLVFGPGSWFTSVIPHFLVPEMAEAIGASPARRVVCLNLDAQTGETEGFSPEMHLDVLAAHAPELELDVVLAGRRAVAGDTAGTLATAVGAFGAELVVRRLGRDSGDAVHDPDRLAAAYAEIMTTGEGDAPWR